ncbi:metallophosphoesterase [Antarcticirhabdus aurantiaca]|uniref:metallophosphoesterase n=1 Tax=Antarcticirhabdus aurantiaca TaxID=2606717 RepID=UPI00131D66F9|nr:metallophosphoesterase [Antarcticirhabdus aurantiaca]
MRIHIISDLHDDYSRASLGNYSIPRDIGRDADAILIAGDIAGRLSRMGRTWLEHQRQATGLPIILCAGNHDYWRGSLDAEIGRFRDRLQTDGIHILDGESLIMGGCRFIGGTLWTDYSISGDTAAAMEAATASMKDFRFIRADAYRRRLRPHALLDEHLRHRAAIEAALATPFDGPTIVLTHHAPSPMSLRDPSYIEDLDASYASDLEPIIYRYRPQLWIHGHTHERKDYWIGGTRILCNPRGYQHAAHARRQDESEQTGFDPRLIVDLADDRPFASWANIEEAIERPDDFQWPFGRQPQLTPPDDAGAAMMRARAERADPAAIARILGESLDGQEDDT